MAQPLSAPVFFRIALGTVILSLCTNCAHHEWKHRWKSPSDFPNDRSDCRRQVRENAPGGFVADVAKRSDLLGACLAAKGWVLAD